MFYFNRVVTRNKGLNRRSKGFFAKPGWHPAESAEVGTS